MLIGMVKDTSTFSVIGMAELTYTVQNIESTTFQPFVLYTALAAIYVLAAFVIDFVFRTIEKSLTTPPKGRCLECADGAAAAAAGVDRASGSRRRSRWMPRSARAPSSGRPVRRSAPAGRRAGETQNEEEASD